MLHVALQSDYAVAGIVAHFRPLQMRAASSSRSHSVASASGAAPARMAASISAWITRSFSALDGVGQAGAMVRWVASFEASKPGSVTASAIGPGTLAQPLKNTSSAAALNSIVFCLIIGNSRDSPVEISRALGPALVLKGAVPPPIGNETREKIADPLQKRGEKGAHAGDFFEITDQAAVPMMISAPTT
ncbi:MAG: hypothetical protein ACK5X3_21800 [Pseudomonadota bacterium]